MSLGFSPNRERLYKEIEQWIALNKLDLLLSLCNCCVNKAYRDPPVRDCRTCVIHAGVSNMTRESRRRAVPGEGLLGVC